jgi:hypothetical protein
VAKRTGWSTNRSFTGESAGVCEQEEYDTSLDSVGCGVAIRLLAIAAAGKKSRK